jgi:hypothetical protein
VKGIAFSVHQCSVALVFWEAQFAGLNDVIICRTDECPGWPRCAEHKRSGLTEAQWLDSLGRSGSLSLSRLGEICFEDFSLELHVYMLAVQ